MVENDDEFTSATSGDESFPNEASQTPRQLHSTNSAPEQWQDERQRRLPPAKRLSPVKPSTANDIQEMDTSTKERHEIGHITQNFLSWKFNVDNDEELQRRIPAPNEVGVVSFQPFSITYDHDGLSWRSDVRVVRNHVRGTWQNSLVIHLPNDGFFHVEGSLLPILASDRENPKLLNTSLKGQEYYLDTSLWETLRPFEEWARQWFSYDKQKKKLKRKILYIDRKNRLDICLLCPELNVSVDFVFEPGFPVPEVPDNYWT